MPDCDAGGIGGDSSGTNGQAHRQHWPENRPEMLRHDRPLERLTDLSLAIHSPAVAELVHLVPSLTRLMLRAMPDFRAADSVAALYALQPLAELPHLRELHVDLPGGNVWPADLLALHGLEQLRSLTLTCGSATGIGAADLAALMYSLHRLDSLELDLDLSHLADRALRIIGEGLPLLRCLMLGGYCDVGRALSAARRAPLFPRLEYLHVNQLGG
jgi:hypothetical protein